MAVGTCMWVGSVPERRRPNARRFDSIEDVLKFVSDYFEQPVVKVKASQMRSPEYL